MPVGPGFGGDVADRFQLILVDQGKIILKILIIPVHAGK